MATTSSSLSSSASPPPVDRKKIGEMFGAMAIKNYVDNIANNPQLVAEYAKVITGRLSKGGLMKTTDAGQIEMKAESVDHRRIVASIILKLCARESGSGGIDYETLLRFLYFAPQELDPKDAADIHVIVAIGTISSGDTIGIITDCVGRGWLRINEVAPQPTSGGGGGGGGGSGDEQKKKPSPPLKRKKDTDTKTKTNSIPKNKKATRKKTVVIKCKECAEVDYDERFTECEACCGDVCEQDGCVVYVNHKTYCASCAENAVELLDAVMRQQTSAINSLMTRIVKSVER